VAWYPIVGLLIGILLAAAERAAAVVWPEIVGAALVVSLWVALSGALHLDGLADAADAAFAPVPRERRLEILRDVHHGTFAVVAVALVLVLKTSALASMSAREAAAIVVFAPVAGRAAIAPAMRLFPTARSHGMGSSARAGATSVAFAVGLAVTASAAVVALGWAGLVAAAVALALGLASAAWLFARFGGLTGDSYGAVVEIVELTALLSGSALVAGGAVTVFPLWSGR
jgi:adenosylcobinamide-GDP ribazoletransferase